MCSRMACFIYDSQRLVGLRKGKWISVKCLSVSPFLQSFPVSALPWTSTCLPRPPPLENVFSGFHQTLLGRDRVSEKSHPTISFQFWFVAHSVVLGSLCQGSLPQGWPLKDCFLMEGNTCPNRAHTLNSIFFTENGCCISCEENGHQVLGL